MRKIIILMAAVAALATLSLVRSEPAVGDAGCLSNDYLDAGGSRIVDVLAEDVAGFISAERASEIAVENAGRMPDGRKPLGAKLVRLSDKTRGVIDAYLVATPVEGQQPIIGTDLVGTAPCEVSVIDARTGSWIYSYILATPDYGASFAPFPTLEH